MLLNSFTNLLPFRQHSEIDVLTYFSLDNTGMGGIFVTLNTGAVDMGGQFAAATPGYNYAGVTNVRYENPNKVSPAASGSFKHQVLGLTLNGTVEFDENGNKVLFNPQVQAEKEIVPSGYSIKVATDGVFRLKASAYSGQAFPGYVGYISNGGNGILQFTGASTVSNPFAVCKVLFVGDTGTFGGGFVDVKLTLK